MKRALLCLGLVAGAATVLQAQQRADTLQGAEVRGKRSAADEKDSYASGTKTQQVDARTLEVFRTQSLGDLLAARSTAFVKSMGLSTFSTLSLRGASAAQSAVYWEGVPLMNGATGLVDVSLLPLAFAGEVRIDYGSSAALRGSGNVGGAVMLEDEHPVFNATPAWRAAAGLGVGAFGQLSGSAAASLRAKRIYVQGGLQCLRAQNDFPAEDERGRSFRMPHASQQQWFGAAQLAYRLNERSTLSLHGQLVSAMRDIPPALFELRSLKEQEEQNLRLLMQWRQTVKGNASLHRYAKLAFFSNALSYEDSSISPQSHLHSRQLFAEAGAEHAFLKKGKLLLFAPLQYGWLREKPATQFRIAVAASAAMPFFLKPSEHAYRLQTALNFRLELFDGTWIALPGMNLSYRLAEGWQLRGNAQYTYRAPTLNELYYQPGGNDALRPEHGWNFDAGLDWKEEHARGWSHSHSLSAYDREIQDWIIWLGGTIWTPHNLAAVHSRGLELENSFGRAGAHFFWRLSLSGALVSSRVLESGLSGDSSIGKQLPYVPPAMAAAVLSFGRKECFIEWNTTYTGLRYTLSDESDWLPGFSISNISAVCNLPLKRQRMRLQLSLNNIFNTRYEVVAFRPMPRFGWAFSALLYLRNDG
jgi:iron complex outermembrane receptor protein